LSSFEDILSHRYRHGARPEGCRHHGPCRLLRAEDRRDYKTQPGSENRLDELLSPVDNAKKEGIDFVIANGENAELAEKFAPVAAALKENEAKIIEELLAVEGKAQDIGGYFHPNDEKAEAAMRPSATLNSIIDAI